MYCKVVRRDRDGRLTSSDVMGVTQVEYIPDVEVTPPYGPAFCFDSQEAAIEYCSFPRAEVWECEGKLSSVQPTRMLLYEATASSSCVLGFWHRVKAREYVALQSTERLWSGTVFLDTVKLTQRLFTSDENRGIDDYNDCE